MDGRLPRREDQVIEYRGIEVPFDPDDRYEESQYDAFTWGIEATFDALEALVQAEKK